jgi:hypothetical protein
MKPILLAALGLCLTSAAWVKADDDSNSTPPTPPSDGGGGPGGEHHHGFANKEDMDKLKAAHEAALQANPDLAAQEKSLHEQQEALHKKIEEAMLKADPSIAPILEKMKKFHHGPPPGGPGGQGGQ